MSSTRGLRRSAHLLGTFRLEQTQPEVFYRAIAEDSIDLISDYARVGDALVLDVGAGREQFAEVFAAHGARYIAIDPDVSLLDDTPASRSTVVGDGYHLPFADGSSDITFCSNVLEHVTDPARLVAELARVTAPGGVIAVSYSNWLGPWGGHETSPYHYFGGHWAARRYTRHYGHPPKNRLGVNMYALSVAEGLRIARPTPGTTLLDARPRYHPDWATWVLAIPGLREFITWNLWFVLRKV